MKRDFILNRIIKVMLLVLSMTVGQNAWAESSWTVENSKGASNTFTIKRSEKGYAQKVLYRTVSLSAYAGQHYTAKYGELEFLENEDTKTVTVTESTPNVDSYKYQNGATRQYKLEVTDRAGLLLASATRDMTIGYNVASSGVFDNKSYTIRSSEVTVTEDGYAQSSNPHTVASTQFYTEGTKAYLVYLNAELRMRLEFQAKEVNDGYQYVQILTDNTTGCDTGAGDGNPGTPNVSHYMAGFDIGGKGVDTYYKYSFPVPSVGNDAGATKPWTELSNSVADLKKQKFNTGCRASDGRLILPTGFSTLVVRFNASGSDEDDWKAKDIKAFIQASDATMPTKLSVSAAAGRHAKGNTVYVSVAFSEIVTVTGTPTLTTTSENHWGSLSYVTGSGTNVLTFSTTIPQDATGDLNITGLSGTVKDLAGNSLSGSVTANGLCSLDVDLAYTIRDFQTDGSGNYLITCHDDLRGLAGYVNGGSSTQSKTFLLVTDLSFPYNDNWNNANSTENNYTAIGTTSNGRPFRGTFDGQGHTISGIRIYKGDASNQGLFGYVGGGGIVKNINLADARITGLSGTGGIVGTNYYATIEDCTVATNVCIHTVQNSYHHGGIVGSNENGSVCHCISRATLTVKNGLTECLGFGGIVGYNKGYNGVITDCIADGVVIPDINGRGAINGSNDNGTLTRNYYLNCTVAGATESDIYTITLGTNITINHSPEATLPGTNNITYDNGADINGVPYAKGTSVVNLSYDPATITEGYDVLLSVKLTSGNTAVAFTDNGNHTYTIASMPAADITVSATEIPVIAYIDADGNPQSHACTPIVDGTYTQYLGAAGCTNWYVVSGEVNTKTLEFKDATTNIILCDGATLSFSVSRSFDAICNYEGSINIFAQSGGTGAITVTTECSDVIYANKSIEINGGAITASDASNIGIISSNGDVTIRRGNINVHGKKSGIQASQNVNIQGGIINVTCDSGSERYGIKARNYGLTLGCSSPNDHIYASSYYAKYNNVRVADGQILSDGTNTYSGTLNSDEIAAIAGQTLSTAIPYIDADGTTKYKASHDLTFITTSKTSYGKAANTEGWYCVNSDVNFSSAVDFLDQAVHIILCDGATFSSTIRKNNNNSISATNGSLTIYGQSLGSGTLSAGTNANAIKANSNIDLNGGDVNVASSAYTGIIADGIITIRRGNIMAQGRSTGISSIYNNVIILGGNVSAVGDHFGISANNITLGYASVTDRITANNYTCNTLTIVDGQTLTNGEGSIISGTYTDDDLLDARSAIDGKTLQPAYSITLPDDFTLTGTTAHQGYAPAGEEVTLHTDAGYTINSASYTPVGGSATTITPVEGVWSFTLPAANTTVSAERSANTYTVHFDANYDNNGIVISGTMDDMAFTYDQAQAITSNTYERTGYTFTGWNTQPDGNGDAYTDGQSVDNLTTELNGVVTLYAQWSIIDWTGTGTSENNPYVITFASQLVKLSNDVNGGNKYTGLFIKLGNDIDMNGVVFEGIGSRLNYFEGTFDGDGYTISNVTIDRSNGSDVVGFFGHISEGTVKNLIIDGASITGKNYVGGIIGYSYKTTISNCLVLNTSITVTTGDKCGVYGHSGGSLTLTNNHYNNCTITIGETTYTTNIGVSRNDRDGVRSVYTLSLPEHVTAASAEKVTIGTTTYYASNVQVTLTTDQGFSLSDVTVNGTPATDNGDGTWSFIMPAQDVTVAATVTMPPVTYIDADGIEQSCTYYTLLTSDDDISNATNNQGYLSGGWYVVDGNIYCLNLRFSGDVHIILADGARLYVNFGINSNGYDLTIYGQAAGSGELSLDYSIDCNNICINGGIINNYNGTFGIQANGNVTINDGTINIRSSNTYGIYTIGYVTINGGTLSVNSNYGIVASNVILASSTSLKTLNIIGDIYVNTISLDRTFTVGKPATVMLPFYMDVNDISGGTFYTFGGVEKENDRWVATMNAVTDYIEPNTPYLVMPTETSLRFTDGTFICTEGGGGGQTADEGSHWTFKGTYDYIKWTTDTSDPDYTAERAAEIGRVYGFAGVQKDGIEVGDFVKVASGAKIRPMSAYLMWSDTPNAQNAPMRGSSRTGSAQELPQSITVRLLDASGTVTNVGEIDTVTGEISFEGWYTLQGVKLEAEPTEPGIYINNGKTVSIQK